MSIMIAADKIFTVNGEIGNAGFELPSRLKGWSVNYGSSGDAVLSLVFLASIKACQITDGYILLRPDPP